MKPITIFIIFIALLVSGCCINPFLEELGARQQTQAQPEQEVYEPPPQIPEEFRPPEKRDDGRVTATMPFAFSSRGEGSTKRIRKFEINKNAGVINVKGKEYPALVYQRQPFGEYVLFQTMVVSDKAWWMVWFYCKEDVMTGVYSTGTNGDALLWEPMGGSKCSVQTEVTTFGAPLPESRIEPYVKRSNYTMSGEFVNIRKSGKGTMTWNDERWDVTVFDHVDCTEKCGDPGWYELHAILEQPERQCFGIFYLHPGDRESQYAYNRCLPDFDDPIGNIVIGGTWSDK